MTSVDGTVHQDIIVTIAGTNDAPVLAADAVHFNSIDYFKANNAGQTVASLLGADSTDVDGPGTGIAIIDSEVSDPDLGHCGIQGRERRRLDCVRRDR